MGKLQALIAKSIKEVREEVNAGVSAAMAKAPGTMAPKNSGIISKKSVANLDIAASRVAEVGYIAKTLRGGVLKNVDSADLSARFKAVGVTTDVAEILPDGFTGTLLHDIQAELSVAKLFPMRTIKGGVAHDTIALYGIEAFLVGESVDGTDSSESYMTFVATTKKVLTRVQKSYEILDDSLIDIAAEVRMGIVRSIAEAVEAGDAEAGVKEVNKWGFVW